MLLYRLVSLALLALSFALRPTHARCPDGRDLRVGVRRSGEFECWSAVVGNPEYDGTWGRPERGVQRDDAIVGRVWCTGGTQPIVVDNRTVACQHVR